MRAQWWIPFYGYAAAMLVSRHAAGAGDTSSHHSQRTSYYDSASNYHNGRLVVNRGGWGHQGGGASTSTFTRPVAFVLPSSTGVWSPASSSRDRGEPRRSSLRSSFLALSNSDQNNENSASSLNNNNNNKNRNALGTTSPSKRKTRNISSEIDYFTKQQISTIFGSGGSSDWNAFVPLSLAGRWSQQHKSADTETNQQQQQSGAAVETVFLSSPEQCQIIADAYEQYLKSNDDVDESINNNNESCIQNNQPTTTLPLPISSSTSIAAIKLLSQTYANTPLSKSVLLSLNSLFLNRDNGLFDNLPWSTWSIDPNLTERDAANNVVDGKFTMGKRVAYQRFMGKDWQGRSLSLGNLANRIRYLLEREHQSDDDDDTDEQTGSSNASMSDEMEDDVMMSLSQRLLELEIEEARMAIAECDQRLAISKTQSTTAAAADNTENIGEKEAVIQLDEARGRLQAAESSVQELNTAMQSEASDEEGASFLSSFVFPWDNDKKSDNNSAKLQSKKKQSLLISILEKLTEQETPPPYRGAIGYPAKLDTKKEVFEDSILPYTSPYELLIDIIEEQLNSEVMCCVLEPTSLLQGNLVLGGALLLKRKGVTKSTTLSGEEVFYTDDDDALGNEGVLPRSMYVVECFSDEAVGMALASEMPIFVEEGICERAGSVPVKLDVRRAAALKRENDGGGGGENRVKDIMESLSFANRVPSIRPLDEFYFSSSRLEGERIASENESNLVRIPLTTNPQLFDGPDQTPQSSTSSSAERRPVFSTFNPVKTLDEYDELTDDDKARLLLKMESFTGILPRPRAVRASTTNANGDNESGTPPSLLDDIILPLVDESVRRQYRIRDAERREDYKEAEALREEASPRQSVLESAQKAREEGLDDEADRLEEEARLYQALRADVTQDEGAYSRFLDRDEWYERETQARIKRLDKSKFGTLLDGIDLP